MGLHSNSHHTWGCGLLGAVEREWHHYKFYFVSLINSIVARLYNLQIEDTLG